jgi:hypothetical protein
MSNDEPLEIKLNKWLKKEGYPLEMRVASAIRKHTNLLIRQGWYYKDPENSTSREIDIVCTASKPRGLSEINFVFECKGTSKPWVLFTSGEAVASYNRLTTFGIFSDVAHSGVAEELFKCDDGSNLDQMKKIPWLIKDGMVGYSITQSFDGNRDVPYKAILSAVKAGVWLKNNSLWQDTEYRNHAISFPIVVTSSPLFECYLDENGNNILNPINHGFVFFNQHMDGFNGTCVSIVNEAHIEDFVTECSEVVKKMHELLKPSLDEDWSDFVRKIKGKST